MDADRRQSTGATIRTLREANGQSRQALATAAGISLEMLAKVEQGRKAPSAATLAALAKGLGLDAPELSLRANAWQALASSGATQAALRAGTISGSLAGGAAGAVIFGPAVMAAAVGVGTTAMLLEARNRRVIGEVLRSRLAVTQEELDEITECLIEGLQAPDEPAGPSGRD